MSQWSEILNSRIYLANNTGQFFTIGTLVRDRSHPLAIKIRLGFPYNSVKKGQKGSKKTWIWIMEKLSERKRGILRYVF